MTLAVDEERAVRRQAGEGLAPLEIGQLDDLPRQKGGGRAASPPDQEAHGDAGGQRDGPEGGPGEPRRGRRPAAAAGLQGSGCCPWPADPERSAGRPGPPPHPHGVAPGPWPACGRGSGRAPPAPRAAGVPGAPESHGARHGPRPRRCRRRTAAARRASRKGPPPATRRRPERRPARRASAPAPCRRACPGAAPRRRVPRLPGELGDAEVEDLHHAVAGHEEVSRFHVAVDDPVCVRLGEPAGGLDGDLEGFLDRQGAAGDAALEALAVIAGHGEEEEAVLALPGLENRAEIGVVQGRGGPRLQ